MIRIAIVLALTLSACSKDSDPVVAGEDSGADLDAEDMPVVDARSDADAAADASPDVGSDAALDVSPDMPNWDLEPLPERPDETATDASRAAGFRLYYRERVNRIVTAGHRYWFMGDVGWATTTRGPKVARTGDQFEVIVGPSDNNRIGNTVWNVYNAYRVFRTRELELTLLRLLHGLTFFEQVTGHPGMTSREAYPGWTRIVDGVGQTVTRTRFGSPVTSPLTVTASLQAEIISTFFDGLRFTYRENPEEFMFTFMPGFRPDAYAMTYSFIELPKMVRSGECCSSLLRTPDDKTWAGAYWGNHNSRDNFPDLGLGYLAAKLVADDASMTTELRNAATTAVAGGNAIGDLVLANDVSIMTVSNIGTYDTFEISGTIRPHGEPEVQDLGTLDVCPMAFMAQAMSSDGLSVDEPLRMARSADEAIFVSPQVQASFGCMIPEEANCTALDDGFCDRPWGAFGSLSFQGTPIFEWLEQNQVAAQGLLQGWQNDFDDVTEAAMVVYHYAKASGDVELIDQARRAIFDLTELQNMLADFAFGDDAERRARQRLRANLYKAECDLPASAEDFAGFVQYEQEAVFAENTLSLGDTAPAALLTDDEIQTLIDAKVAGTLEHVADRYRAAYPDGPPVRRTAAGYEARGDDENVWPWRDVEVPRHATLGSPALLEAIPLCEQAPQWLSCEWAVLGCERPDLDRDRTVGAADAALFQAAQTTHAGQTCDDANLWCDGADLDRSGSSDASDAAFMTAADGCWY